MLKHHRQGHRAEHFLASDAVLLWELACLRRRRYCQQKYRLTHSASPFQANAETLTAPNPSTSASTTTRTFGSATQPAHYIFYLLVLFVLAGGLLYFLGVSLAGGVTTAAD
ncbi:hypothetical protein [Pseudomonas sp. AMR01]|uniref:hypothetical protein n=1 Tax=Pseudomonas sp. AMR01 TaxID=3064904 RepID=UPI0035BF3EBF